MKSELHIHGHKIFVETAGPPSGSPVVLLHHGLGAISSWKAQIPALAEAGYRVLAYDRWGHGKSSSRERWAIPYFRSDLADFEAICEHFNLLQPVLIGHSDGGKIAMYHAAEHPGRMTCLVLVGTHIYIEPKMAPGIEAVRHNFEHDHRFEDRLRLVHGENTDSLFWGWFNGWHNPDIKDWDMRPLIGRITCPTLVVQGLQDEHATPQHARDIAETIPHAELWLLPEVGHMPAQEAPEKFNQRILQFIRKSQIERRPKAGVKD
jgi:pimeloyl-ACP methyl ester carboxylesterase